jgi:hypothetical protein
MTQIVIKSAARRLLWQRRCQEACGQEHDGGAESYDRILEVTGWENIMATKWYMPLP